VRPQHWQISEAEEARIVGTVVSQRRAGPERRAEIALETGARFEIRLEPGDRLTQGERLSLKPQRWRLFFADGGVLDPTVSGAPEDYTI
jgi:ABC-type sulfate/molybdate transport systems ATPase subunit